MVHSALKNCNIVLLGQHADWQPQQVKNWVEAASGKISFQSRLTDDTTHLVLSEKKWKEQSPLIQEAITRKEQGQNIHILAPDWLDDSLRAKSKRSENPFSWLKKASLRASKSSEPRSTAGLMSQVFTESTEGFLSQSEKSRIAKRKQLEQEAREEEKKKQNDAIEKQREQANIKALAAMISRGVVKGRNELLTDGYGVYTDGMGLRYDVVLKPVEEIEDAGDRYTVSLQIYESKVEPYVYAFNAKFSGTKKLPQNNIIVCVGCNFLTAFRSFRKIFRQMTRVEWADRMTGTPKQGAQYKYVRSADGLAEDDIEVVEKPTGKDKGRVGSPGQPVLNGEPLAFGEAPNFSQSNAYECNGYQPTVNQPSVNQSSVNSSNGQMLLDAQTADRIFGNQSLSQQPVDNGATWDFESVSGALDQNRSVLGKRNGVEEAATDARPSKLMKPSDFSTDMPQDIPPSFGGEQYAFGAPNGSAPSMIPRGMADYQTTNDADEDAAKLFDFSMGETI